MDNFLDNLNPVQRAAVEHTEGPNLIIAGAGSGKTKVLTCKIAMLLTKGVSPSAILALTFTNKAAREMKERVMQAVGKRADMLRMGTFHSVFSRILRYEAANIGFNSNFTIYDATDSLSLIRGIIKEMNLDDKVYKEKDIQNRISNSKNHLISAAAYASNAKLVGDDTSMRKPKTADIYLKYVARCKSANAMDFDDLLFYSNVLFRDRPDVLEKYRQVFRYILVDEYQDTNVAQYHIVNRLAEKERNITVVGDDAQSIYSFRGARIENILNFRKDYPDYAEFKLEQNYRSTRTIVDAANSLISKNKRQLKKTCFSKGETGEKIEVSRAFTDREEGVLVASSILDAVHAGRVGYSETAILYRTNAQSRIFEDSLRKRNIPYRIYGGISFYQRAEIKDVLAYLRLAANPLDDESFRRVINYPARGIGASSMEKIQTYASTNGLTLWDTVRSVSLPSIGVKESIAAKIVKFADMIAEFVPKAHSTDAFAFASALINRSGIKAELKANKSPEGISRAENVEELLNGIKEYTDSAENKSETRPVTEYLQNVALITDADKPDSDDLDRVSLMTIHSAKGLEFNYVYVVGMEEGLFPATGTMTSEHELEEERRLFYVALTRAAVKVHISFAQARYRWGSLVSPVPSRFLRDIDARYLSAPSITGFSSDSRQPFHGRESGTDDGNKWKEESIFARKSSIEEGELDIRLGTEVEHARFGRGRVCEIEDYGGNPKLKIDFQEAGQKTLLLKFAKLTIIKKN
ncbi:MAG: UvrD-helicase domain-containing protein [Prevotellaceae bacterium]|nr:UvrD-helicase domain-containing protein [Prevotellaceae bacterium]